MNILEIPPAQIDLTIQKDFETNVHASPWRRINGCLRIAEAASLYSYVRRIKGNALEIGSYKGRSGYLIATGMKNSHNLHILTCIDIFYESDPHHPRYKESLLEDFSSNLKDFLQSGRIRYIKGNSTDPAIIRQMRKSVELIFIDGDHSYEACRSDILNYWHLLKVGGFLVLHDMNWKIFPGLVKISLELTDGIGVSDPELTIHLLKLTKVSEQIPL